MSDTRVSYLVYLNMVKDGQVSTPHDMCMTLKGAITGMIPEANPQVYVSMHKYQPDDGNRRAFDVYVSLVEDLPRMANRVVAQNSLRQVLSIALPGRNGMISLAPDSLQPRN